MLDLSVRGVADDPEPAGRAQLATGWAPPLGELLAAASALVDAAVARALATMGGRHDPAVLSALCQMLNRATTRALVQSGVSAPPRIPGRRPPGGDGDQMPVAERSQVARELHDRIGQSIEIAYRNLEIHEITSSSAGTPDHRISAAQHALRDALHGVRAIISDMREPVPGENLAAALGRYVSSVSHYDVDVRVAVRGEEDHVPSSLLDEVFVMVREALHNAVRHAAATRAEARIDIEPTEVRACVLDDGVGFDPARRRTGGVGLRSMTDRAAAAGGAVVIDSVPGLGTRVDLTIPLAAPETCSAGLRT
ncbi:sensor histidine kinase [Jidongwangia harbinensis]|uniref:sensor histidine kinase n=1 Tax=Jidongwangia harbinensis TaxID=2878561 RepID=UPI001CD9C774|nr:ATP-binding protein [Jidongwangia harbinensis]MCA2219200.1 histidine kinase [Jidongwangia harbinensis]